MSLTPLFTSLTVVLATRTLLAPFDRRPQPWLRLLLVIVVQSLLVIIPIANDNNWWTVVTSIVVIDLVHLLLINLKRVPAPLTHLCSFLVATVLIAAVVASPAVVPSFGRAAEQLAQGLRGKNALLDLLTPGAFRYLSVVACGLWIAGIEANNPIVLFIKRSNLMPASVESSNEPSRGRIIGISERMIVFVLTITGNLSALGLVLAAKALARFKDLDQRDFAEYVLIGTLLSITAAVLIGLLMKPALS